MHSTEERLEALEGAIVELQRQRRSLGRRLRVWQGLAAAALLAGALFSSSSVVTAQGNPIPGSVVHRLAAVETTIALHSQQLVGLQRGGEAMGVVVDNLEDLLLHFNRVGNDIILEGANLHIRSGQGATNGNPANPTSVDAAFTNGFGNLIIGYNEEPDGFELGERSGSHNLVIGPGHRFTGYGGQVVGDTNNIMAPFASVSGGTLNLASGNYSTVGGGGGNFATGEFATVSGGVLQIASTNSSWAAGSPLATSIIHGTFRSP